MQIGKLHLSNAVLNNYGKLIIATLTFLILTACRPDAVDTKNHPVNISDFKGKWVLIQYWTTWCPLCIEEIPMLNTLAKYYPDQVVVFAVNPSHLTNARLNHLKNAYRIQYVFLQSFPIEKWGGKVKQLPVIFILDKKGRLDKTLLGLPAFSTLQKILKLPNVVYD